MKRIAFDLSRYEPQEEEAGKKERILQTWQRYVLEAASEFSLEPKFKAMLLKLARVNLSYVRGKVENAREKFPLEERKNKGHYLIATFRRGKS